MTTLFAEVRQTLLPGAMPGYGPLPPLLLVLTVVTGLVDAFSYLTLGHIFVANMTGNVVFLGFALAGVSEFSIGHSLVAVGAFVLGALAGGKMAARLGARLGYLLTVGAAVQALFLAASVALAVLAGTPVSTGYRYGLLASLAIAMGLRTQSRASLPSPT